MDASHDASVPGPAHAYRSDPDRVGLWVTMQVSAGSSPLTGVPPKTVLPAGEAAAWAGRAGNLYFPPFSEL